MKAVGPILLVIGLCLVVLSSRSGSQVPQLTEEDTQRFEQASIDLHAASLEDTAEAKAKIEKASAVHEEAERAMKAAEEDAKRKALTMRMGGLICSILGAVLFFYSKAK